MNLSLRKSIDRHRFLSHEHEKKSRFAGFGTKGYVDGNIKSSYHATVALKMEKYKRFLTKQEKKKIFMKNYKEEKRINYIETESD